MTTAQEAKERQAGLSRKKLRKLMIDADLTGVDIARIMGINFTQISHVLRGARDTESTLKAICDCICKRLGQDPKELFPEYARLWSPWSGFAR